MDSEIIELVLETVFGASQFHYLPDCSVLMGSRTTLMVFDVSSNATRPSLNDCLYPGPSLSESLLGAFFYFRLNNIAFISDIEKTKFTSQQWWIFCWFLWFDDAQNLNLTNVETAPFWVYSLCWALFGVTSIPFLLTRTFTQHLIHSYPLIHYLPRSF